MAVIKITTTPGEHEAVIAALRVIGNKPASVAKIADEAQMTQNRTRYTLVDLEESGKIKKNLVKAFNEKYKRYSYEVVE